MLGFIMRYFQRQKFYKVGMVIIVNYTSLKIASIPLTINKLLISSNFST